MQQCRFVYTITRADCRACNGLDARCRNYEPNPDEFERGNVEDGYGDGDRGIGAGRMRGMVLWAGRRMAGSDAGTHAPLGRVQRLGVAPCGEIPRPERF